jgi:hypothetical protein
VHIADLQLTYPSGCYSACPQTLGVAGFGILKTQGAPAKGYPAAPFRWSDPSDALQRHHVIFSLALRAESVARPFGLGLLLGHGCGWRHGLLLLKLLLLCRGFLLRFPLLIGLEIRRGLEVRLSQADHDSLCP